MLSNLAGTTFEDVVKKSSPPCLCVSCCCSVFWLIVIVLFFPLTVIQLGQKRYGLARNKLSGVVNLETTFTPGRYWLGFWRDFVEFPSTLNTIEFSEESPEEGVQDLPVLASRDQDGKQIFLDVSIQYKLMESEIGQLFKEYNLLYENVYISALRDALTKAGNQFQIAKVWEDYRSINQIMKEACDEVLKKRHAVCWDLQLWRVRLDDRYEEALVRTQVRKQAQETEKARSTHTLVRAGTQVLLAEYRKNITSVQGSGEAQVYQITREAEANAAANIISANAELLDNVRKIVKVTSSGKTMNDTELVTYRKLMMLQGQQSAHMVYSSAGVSMQADDVRSVRMLANTRRLGEASDPLEL